MLIRTYLYDLSDLHTIYLALDPATQLHTGIHTRIVGQRARIDLVAILRTWDAIEACQWFLLL